MESVAEQITSIGFKVGGARLKDAPEDQFKEFFVRFIGDELNYWNEEKQQKAGQLGFIVTVYGDSTVTMMFNDGSKWDFPFEAIECAVKIQFIEAQPQEGN